MNYRDTSDCAATPLLFSALAHDPADNLPRAFAEAIGMNQVHAKRTKYSRNAHVVSKLLNDDESRKNLKMIKKKELIQKFISY